MYCAKNLTSGAMPTPDQTYHDVWSAIASGARGIGVFAYWHALHDDPALASNLQQLNIAASQISGTEQIGDLILNGTPNPNVTFTVTSGPTQTVAFTPPNETIPFQYPSINILSKTRAGIAYIIAVNSTDQSVTANISNLPTPAASASLPFENRSVTISNGSFTDSFSAWGVHIYKMPTSVTLDRFTIKGDTVFQFGMTNSAAPSYTILSSTNLLNWALIGSATQLSASLYQFTDPFATGHWQRFYRLRWP
jgi:hypothetical protein